MALSFLLSAAACGGDDGEQGTTALSGQETASPTDGAQDDGGGVTTPAATTEEPQDTGDSSRDTVDACALLTSAEAEAILGAPVGEPEQNNTVTLFGCSYEGDGVSVLVDVEVNDDPSIPAGAYQYMIDTRGEEKVDGLGDIAYRHTDDVLYDISVLKGRYDVSIGIESSLDSESEFAAAKAVAEKVIARIP